MKSLSVAVVVGGPSPEAEVSRTSGRAVRDGLVASGHRATVHELEPSLACTLAGAGYDVAFPVVHGPLGEDGCLQGLFEVLGIAYVGSGVLASALAMDKPKAKLAFRAHGLPLADEVVVRRSDSLDGVEDRVFGRLGPRVVVKPTAAGSAIGVTRVEQRESLREALSEAFSAGADALVEALHDGLEVTCGVLEDDSGRAEVLPPVLIIPKAAGWYDFSSRYGKGGSEHRCPPPFEPTLDARIRDVARRAHEAVGARDLSRADFVVDDRSGNVTLLEVNTLPGMTSTSLFPESAAVAGVPFTSLCDRLVRRAYDRPKPKYRPALAMP